MWLKWTFVGLLALESICKIVLIDEPRKPVTKTDAAASVIVNALLIVALLHYWR